MIEIQEMTAADVADIAALERLCFSAPWSENSIAEELDMKKAAKSVGEKSVEMIHVKDINAITGYIRGGCTAIGMKKQYVTRIDESAKTQEQIYVSGGRIGSQIQLKPDDLAKAAKAEFADIIRHEN